MGCGALPNCWQIACISTTESHGAVGWVQASAASERERALAALCWAQEEVLRSMTLDMTLSSDIRSQDINTVILGVARRSREGLQAAWDFYRRCTLRDCSIAPKEMLQMPQLTPELQVQCLPECNLCTRKLGLVGHLFVKLCLG